MSAFRKYAPDRRVDIQHLALDITPDFQKRTILGNALLKFKPIAEPLAELRLNAVDLNILSTSSSENSFKFQQTDQELIFTFSPPVPVGKDASVSIDYSATPLKGLYFRTEEMGYASTHLWTQGEPAESRYWFPCFDHPVEKFTSEVTCHLPAGMVALSNGKQLPQKTGARGLTAHHWLQDKPHVNYLITLAAGKFVKIEDRHREIPLEFWTTPEDAPQARNSFRNTKNVMEFFEKETGIPYPWAKYGQVAVHDYHWGGMENTSLTTLNNRTLFDTETENLFNSDSLVAHELAHQWFGDLVTCRDWSHIWLNEGFATYYDWLWQGHFGGRNETLLALYDAAKGILSNTNETRGIVWRKFGEPGEMFNYLAYPKGAWVLNMLRSQLGEDLYRKCIRTYLERHAYGSVTTDQLRAVIEEFSGRSYERFFDQWVYGIGAPILDVAFSWDEKSALAKLAVKQTQKITEEAHLFQFPLKLRFSVKGQTIVRSVEVQEKEQDFYIPLPNAPDSVRIDPDQELLAKINFSPARPMLFVQLADDSDVIGQLLALEKLSDKPDADAVEKIRGVLENAHSYRVRMRAAEGLRQARTPEAIAGLCNSLQQSDARVRNAIVKALGGIFNPAASTALQKIVASEKNPAIAASALEGLAPYQSAEVQAILAKGLATASYRERIANGAINAMKTQDDPANTAALVAAIRGRFTSTDTQTLGAALQALGALTRNEPQKDAAREVLLSHLNHAREGVRLAAIAALGNLEDPRAIPALQTFAGANSQRPEKSAAEAALEKIRGARKPSEELKGLRTEVSELRKSGDELKKQVETLTKKLEAKP